MKKTRLTAFLAFLLVMTSLLSLTAEADLTAAVPTTSDSDAAYYWDSDLPKSGDKSYKTDGNWYRLVLTWGNDKTYATNSISEYYYEYDDVDAGPTKASWPGYPFDSKDIAKDAAKAYKEIWPDKTQAFSSGKVARSCDLALYSNAEYTADDYYSLFIKYAGKSAKTGEDCWYISPCGPDGNRQDRLWALDCYLLPGLKWDDSYPFAVTPINGYYPEFNLLTPTFEEFENDVKFTHAATSTDLLHLSDASVSNGYGIYLGDYHDNEKWIITKEGIGWTIKSAGYVNWDYAHDHDLTLQGTVPEDLLEESLEFYAKIAGEAKEKKTFSVFYVTAGNPFEDITAFFLLQQSPDPSPVAMAYLSDFAENVYLTPGSRTYEVTFDVSNSNIKSVTGPDSCNRDEHYTRASSIFPSYNLELVAEFTEEQRKHIKYDDGYAYYDGTLTSIRGDNGELLFDDDLRDAGFIRYEDRMTFTSTNTFSGLYVGVPLRKDYLNNTTNTKKTLDSGVTATMGKQDSNGDGVLDGVGFIGPDSFYTPTSTTVQINKGAVLQIDGPTFVSPGQNILVKGTLVINAGASLSPWRGHDYMQDYGDDAGFTVTVDGGTVFIASGGLLYPGKGTITVKNQGQIVNSGILIQDTMGPGYSHSITKMVGGSIENNAGGWLIIGAEVRNNCIQNLLRVTRSERYVNDPLYIAADISGMSDMFIRYISYDYNASAYYDVIMVSGSGSELNLVRNAGNCFFMGAVKSVSGKGRSTLMSSAPIYRLRDLYRYSPVGLYQSETGVLEEYYDQGIEHWGPDIERYYEYTDIMLSDSPVFGDPDADTEARRQNLYALRVGTGSQGTSNIQNFTVTYVGTDGKEHAQFISPSDLRSTYDFATAWKYGGVSENLAGDSELRNNMDRDSNLRFLNESILSKNAYFSSSVDAMTDRFYLFQTLYPISYVKSISFVGSGSGAWTCTALNVYSVAYLYPVREYGYASQDWYLPFTGALIAETELNSSGSSTPYLNFSWDSETITIGTGLYRLNVYTKDTSAKSETDRSGFTYYNVSHNPPNFSSVSSDYTFVITLADTEGAGMESFYSRSTSGSLSNGILPDAELTGYNYRDLLTLSLTYVTTGGVPRSVQIPFALDTLMWTWNTLQAENPGQFSSPLHGLFQQGEELVFRGNLPNFDHALEATVSYNDPLDPGSSIAIAGISIHSAYYASVQVTNGMLKPEYPISPISFYAAPTTSGVIVNDGQSMTATMKTWNGTESLTPKERGSRYLVVVQTDEMSEASTVNDVYVSFTYEDLQSTTQETETYSLRRKVNDYFGYWLPEDGTESCGYDVAMTAGQQAFFVIDPGDAYRFLTATFSMDDSDLNDQWQMNGVTVYELEELGAREVNLGSGVYTDSFSTNRTYYRDNVYGPRRAVSTATGTLMIGAGESKTISFVDGDVSGGGGNSSPNKATGVEALTYADTLADFGFDMKRVKYTVFVQVAGDAITSAADGDCGSKNQFYFQLVFRNEEGKLSKSSYVLSNQQLQADGFRTGTKEQFVIYANDDYGEPIQVNIIPDDTSSTSDVFDKLNIESITVGKTSTTGVNLSWKTQTVGWIDIDYKDDSESANGRTAEELTKSFALKPSGYSVMLEFGIETAPNYYDGRQFVGQMVADITYRDGNDRIQTLYNVDVVAAIADYANMTSHLGVTPVAGTQISLPDFMFRKGYTNRFQVTFDDIRSLIRIKLKITPEEDMTWCLSNVFARQVFNDGTLSYNIFNEYERYYAVTPQDLCSTSLSTTGTKRVALNAGDATYLTLNFDAGNSITVDLTKDEEDVDVEPGEALGSKDSISITAELLDTAGLVSGDTVPVTVYYKNIYGDAYKVSATMVFDAATQKYIVPKSELPSTPFFGIPCKVELTGTGTTGGRAIDKVTVNQIRDGQPMAEYVFAADDNQFLENGKITVISYTSSQQEQYAKEKGLTSDEEILYLELGTATEKTLLTGSRDVQAAIVYTERNDPYNYEHTSEYVSLMSSGYASIVAGDVLEIPFKISNVGGIKSVILKTTDASMKIAAGRACVVFHEISDISGDVIAAGWANVPHSGVYVSTDGTELKSDGNTFGKALADKARISPVKLSLTLPQIGRSDAYVKVTVNYLDTDDKLKTISAETSAAQWNREPVWIMTTGLKGILYYEVSAYDKDATNLATVVLSNMTVGWYDTTATYMEITSSLERNVVEGTPVSGSAVNVQMRGAVYLKGNAERVALEGNMITEGRTDYSTLVADENTDVIVQAVLDGYAKDLKVAVTDTATGEAIQTKTYTDTSSAGKDYDLSVSFTPPANPTLTEKRYEVKVYSGSVPDVYSAIVYVTVPAARLEGFALVNGSQRLSFTETGDGSNTTGSIKVDSGTTIDFYIRELHAVDDLTASGKNAITGAAVSCSFTSKTYTNTTGVWRCYSLTIPKSTSDAVYNYTFRAKSAPLQYVLTVNAARSEASILSKGTVFLELGNGTSGTLSSARDLEIAVTYISKNDLSSHTSEYVSAYYSCGTVLESGTVLAIPVEMENAGQIMSVQLRTTSTGVTVCAENAAILVYETNRETGSESYVGWVNCGGSNKTVTTAGITMNANSTAFSDSNGRLTPMRLQPTILSADSMETVIRVTVYYSTTGGDVASVSAGRLLGDWPSEGVWVLADNFDSLLYYEVTVTDNTDGRIASSTVDALAVNWYNGSKTNSKSVSIGKLVTEDMGSYTGLLCSAGISGTLSTSDGSVTAPLSSGSVTVPAGCTVNISASLDGFNGFLNAEFTNGSDSVTKSDYRSLTFSASPMANSVYTLRVSADLFPDDLFLELTVIVSPESAPDPTEGEPDPGGNI